MSIGLLFWIIMIIALLFGAWSNRGAEGKFDFAGFGGSLVLWILLALLGWHAFGPPIR
jgi:hypothetical protein